MEQRTDDLRNQISVLENLSLWQAEDEKVFKHKLEILRNIVLRLIDEIDALDYVRSVNIRRGINLHEEMRHFEIHLVQSALERTGGHQTRAANLLGINLTTLHNKLKRLQISPEDIVNAPVIHEDINYTNGAVNEY